MVSERKLMTSNLVVVLFVAVLSAAGTVWLMSGNTSDEAIAFRAKEARYLNQIESLKLALTSNSSEFDRERGLAARLQRELQDANRQINDLARQLAEAQRTISQRNKQLKEARVERSTTGAATSSRFARMETTSALIVSRATSDLGLGTSSQVADRRVSRYSPSRRRHARATQQQRRRAHVEKQRRLVHVRRSNDIQNVRVASIGSADVRQRAGQAQAWPLSQLDKLVEAPASVADRNDRLDFGIVTPSIVVQPKVARSKLQRARIVRRRTASVRRRQARRARYARYSRLGRLRSKRSRRGVRQRKSRMSSFKRKAFGLN